MWLLSDCAKSVPQGVSHEYQKSVAKDRAAPIKEDDLTPTQDIALSGVCSAYFSRHCITEMTNSNGDLHSSRAVECVRNIMHCRAKAEFGATNERIAELLGKCPTWHTDDVVSSSIVPTAYC